MIKITSAFLICLFFISCNNIHDKNNADNISENASTSKNGSPNPAEERKVTKRDYSITAANAYNDIFLDSSAFENFIGQKKLPDSITRRIRSFYNARNYQYAWFYSKGLTEQALAFWNLHNYATYQGDTSLKDAALQKKMDDLIADTNMKVNASDQQMANIEMLLTQHFIQYSLSNYEKGFLKRKEMEKFIPIKKEDPVEVADSLLNKKHKDNKYFEEINNAYKLLKEELNKYVQIQKNGGWQQVTADPKQFKAGVSSPAVAYLKRRLQVTFDMSGGDTTEIQDSNFLNGIKHFQQRFGYKPDGIVTPGLIKDMNVPVEKRIEQILINMNRMRWMPQEPGGKLILVNIPEFELHVVDGKSKVFDMDVVVGKEGHNTMLFTGKLSTIVFSPYWNVPPSIVKKEILPHMARNKNYLASQHMEVTGNSGGLPVVRQLPGEKNSLGKVKFLFPNSFDIYFHDTPAKSLFGKDKRAFSHGCIRLSDPLKMAEFLLKNNSEWTSEKIIEAMNSGKERFVNLKDPVPVFITYYTAWVNEDGLLNFRDDIYKRDSEVAQKMFTVR